MIYARFPLSLRQVEDLLHERGIDICYETVRAWWNRFGPMFAAEIKKEHSAQMRAGTQWCWHLDEVFVRINGRTYYLWRAVNHEGEVLEAYVTKRRDRKAALRFLRKAMQHYGHPEVIVTDRLRSYGAAMREIGDASRQETGRWLNNRAENAHQPLRRRARDGEVQDFEITSEVCCDPRFRPQPLQSGTSSRQPPNLQAQPHCCSGGVATTCSLRAAISWHSQTS